VTQAVRKEEDPILGSKKVTMAKVPLTQTGLMAGMRLLAQRMWVQEKQIEKAEVMLKPFEFGFAERVVAVLNSHDPEALFRQKNRLPGKLAGDIFRMEL
jgi:hypothetical protein